MDQPFTLTLTDRSLRPFSAARKAFERAPDNPGNTPLLTVRSSSEDGTSAVLACGPYRFAAPLEATAVHDGGTAAFDCRPLDQALSAAAAGCPLVLSFDPARGVVFLDTGSHQRTVQLAAHNEPAPHRYAKETTRLSTPALRAALHKALPVTELEPDPSGCLLVDRQPDSPEDDDGKPIAYLVTAIPGGALHQAVPVETTPPFQAVLDPVLTRAFADVHVPGDRGLTRLAVAHDDRGAARSVLLSYQGHLSGPLPPQTAAVPVSAADRQSLQQARQHPLAGCELDTPKLLAALQAFPADTDHGQLLCLEFGPDGLALSQRPAGGGLAAAALARVNDAEDRITWQTHVCPRTLKCLAAVFEASDTVLVTYGGPQTPLTLSSLNLPQTVAGLSPQPATASNPGA